MPRWIRLPLLFAAVVLAASAQKTPEIRVALVGDSTVNDQGGWGPGFAASFGPPVRTLNFALNGRSSKSFRDEGAWTKTIASHPDYVLLQFGHNDVPGKGADRETDPATTYRANLVRYIDEAVAAGARPVLVTSITRRNFDSAGKIRTDSLAPYVEQVRALAAEKSIAVIDLYTLTVSQANRLGPSGSEIIGRKDAAGKLDTTHLGPYGQQTIGVMAARELVRAVPALQSYWHELVSWRDAARQPDSWHSSAEATRIADQLVLYQHDNGGWEKNIDMAAPLGSDELKAVTARKSQNLGETTIDNEATYTQMRFLARVHRSTGQDRFAAGFRRGLEFLLAAQYPVGGWPQFYPLRDGYWSHITFNDDAMVGVMRLLRSVADNEPDYAFCTPDERARARRAFDNGIRCILKTQVSVRGKLTVWCAQHDEKTLAPAKARAYEHPSLSGSESVGLVELLMDLDKPSPEIIAAVQSAIAWFAASRIQGIRIDRVPAAGTPRGTDIVVVEDPAAPPQWARFYEIETNRPIFSGRDSVVKYRLSEIEYERRNGYRWYTDRPARLLDERYPKWLAKWSPGKDARRF